MFLLFFAVFARRLLAIYEDQHSSVDTKHLNCVATEALQHIERHGIQHQSLLQLNCMLLSNEMVIFYLTIDIKSSKTWATFTLAVQIIVTVINSSEIIVIPSEIHEHQTGATTYASEWAHGSLRKPQNTAYTSPLMTNFVQLRKAAFVIVPVFAFCYFVESCKNDRRDSIGSIFWFSVNELLRMCGDLAHRTDWICPDLCFYRCENEFATTYRRT